MPWMPSSGVRRPARASGLAVQRLAVYIALLLSSALPAAAAVPGFTDATAEVGLDFVHGKLLDTPGTEMHGGGTVGDFNDDGWPDLFVVGGGTTPDRLFVNHGGTFVDEAAQWGLGGLYRGCGAAAADYDRDGDQDLFVTSFGDLGSTFGDVDTEARPGYHRLYRNDAGVFTEVAAEAGVRFTAPHNADGYSPVFGDYDLDGDLDLWVGGWHAPRATVGGFEIRYQGTRLFRNEGDGTFVDVSVASGIYDETVRGFSAAFVDMDGDRFPELLVAGDFGTSRYFINRGDGSFDARPLSSARSVTNGMGMAVGDFDADGRQDWFVTSIYPAYHYLGPPGNFLFLNLGGHDLRVAPLAAGIADGGWGWGATAFDFDHDGWLDLFHTGGWRYPDIFTGETFDDEQSYLFRNRGDGGFDEMAVVLGIDHYGQGRAAGTLDFDRDGDLDLFVLSNDEELRLYRNDLAGEDARWLQIRLRAGDNPRVAPDGRGSQVRLTDGAGRQQVAQLTGHSNYLGGSELLLHFGLGSQLEVPLLTVEWADGSLTVLEGLAVDQRLEIGAPAPAAGFRTAASSRR